jgi:hypothetical protein
MEPLIDERTIEGSIEAGPVTIPCQSTERTSRELDALLRITSVLGSVTRLAQLEQKLIDTIGEVIPADRGAIILLGDSIEHFTSIFGWDRTPERHQPVAVSRATIEWVLHERVAALSNGVKAKPRGEDAEVSEVTAPFPFPRPDHVQEFR